jgi:hypothetical protein
MTAPAVRAANPLRPLYLALYLVALVLVLPPILEYLIVLSAPYQLGNTQWRFGAVGLFVNSFAFSPLLGVTLAIFTALQLGHLRTSKVLSILAIVAGVGVLLSLPLFLLDFLQVRASVAEQAKRAFTITSVKATISGVIVAATGIAVGIGGLRTGRPGLRASKQRVPTSAANTMIVGGGRAEATQA